ncbi:MAG: T9SS type A sorting domain-containing protein [Chitinophagaceae bacterium]|nr:T9SS type A sorting domain-containing protein [Chitinophagaceae bacterium]
MVDNDGSVKYSSVVFLRKPAGTSEYAVLGNPFRDEIVLKCKVFQNQKIDVQLFSSNGVMLRRESYTLVPGMSLYSIKGFERLPSGSYILSIWDGKQKTSIKLLK